MDAFDNASFGSITNEAKNATIESAIVKWIESTLKNGIISTNISDSTPKGL